MAISDRSGASMMEDLDVQFFDTLRRFRELAEATGGRYQIEHDAEMRPVAVVFESERYPITRPEAD